MKTILKPEDWVLKLYPEQKNYSCKLSKFVLIEEYDDEILVFHTITWAIYVLTKEEYKNILNNEYLKTFFVVIDEDFDDMDIAEKAYKERIVKKKLPTYDYISTYVILTTTACNARCHYCYEKNAVKIETMTLDTAENVVQFIKTHKYHNSPVNIQWFGGEPLLNTKVIDYISNRLKEMDIPFKSSIITNAHLFNYDTVIKASKDWNITSCQITIDGLFETYNKIKNFVYSDIDAFLVLIENMKTILDNSDIHVTVRFNIGNENIFQMYDTISYLKEEFKSYLDSKKISFYAYKLFDIIEGKEDAIPGFEDEVERLKEIININNGDKCDTFTGSNTFKREPIYEMCMAYNGNGIAILPNGQFSPCEHIRTEDLIGNIKDDVIDNNIIEKWQTLDGKEIDYCRKENCPLHPLCPRFYTCPNAVICSETNIKKEERLKEAHKRLYNTYTYYKNEIQKRKVGN